MSYVKFNHKTINNICMIALHNRTPAWFSVGCKWQDLTTPFYARKGSIFHPSVSADLANQK